MKKLNPWDIGPTELIQFALERMHGGSEFDKRLSFLVLDVGVDGVSIGSNDVSEEPVRVSPEMQHYFAAIKNTIRK